MASLALFFLFVTTDGRLKPIHKPLASPYEAPAACPLSKGITSLLITSISVSNWVPMKARCRARVAVAGNTSDFKGQA